MKHWPAPLLQPDRHKDCLLYSVAYLCHCFGYPEVTPEQVRAFRAEQGLQESTYPATMCRISSDHHWLHTREKQAFQRFWLGPHQRSWVERSLASGRVGLISVERTPGRAHSLVLLENQGETGVLVMDPLYGHRIDTWEWFLSVGPGHHGCHRIDGWYSTSA